MKEKGQLFTMELLLSLLVISLVLAFTLHSVSIQQKKAVEDSQFLEVQNVARRAGNLFLGNPGLQCYLRATSFQFGGIDNADFNPFNSLEPVYPEDLFKLPGTIDLDSHANINRSDLGIPSSSEGFKCEVDFFNSDDTPYNGIQVVDCLDSYSSDVTDNVFSIERDFIACNSFLTQDDVKSGLSSTLRKSVRVVVWK